MLRRPTAEDAEPLYRAYTADAEVTRYLTWRPHGSVDETRGFLQKCEEMWASGRSFPFVITHPARSAEPFGMIHFSGRPYAVEFGYALAQHSWGNGYMAEALRTLTEWCLAQPAIWRVSAFCDVENTASARVMEKAGLQFEGKLRRYKVLPNVSPEPRDVLLYAKTRP